MTPFGPRLFGTQDLILIAPLQLVLSEGITVKQGVERPRGCPEILVALATEQVGKRTSQAFFRKCLGVVVVKASHCEAATAEPPEGVVATSPASEQLGIQAAVRNSTDTHIQILKMFELSKMMAVLILSGTRFIVTSGPDLFQRLEGIRRASTLDGLAIDVCKRGDFPTFRISGVSNLI